MSKRISAPLPLAQKLVRLLLMAFAIYVLSILIRVSLAEEKYFGRSDLIPLSQNGHKYKAKTLSPKSFQSGSYHFDRNGQKIIVWRQKINGFQHVYGPALMAYELGDKASDWTFCANEYMEAFFDVIVDDNGISESDILDRRKDLHHNAFGRRIAADVKHRGLSGQAGYDALLKQVLSEVESDRVFIPHYEDPRVKLLPTETEMGCPGLPPPFSLYPIKK